MYRGDRRGTVRTETSGKDENICPCDTCTLHSCGFLSAHSLLACAVAVDDLAFLYSRDFRGRGQVFTEI